jgi:hypothetical protein
MPCFMLVLSNIVYLPGCHELPMNAIYSFRVA